MFDLDASDLHLTVGVPPTIRKDGSLMPLPYAKLSAEKVQSLAYSVLTDKQKKEFEQNNELDLSFGITNLSRFRANVFKQRGTVAMAIRTIPFQILAFDALGLPPIVNDLVKLPKGLILVTGPTGSGKSTTLASIIDKINDARHSHIITIEDPIEYVHKHKNCIINQREIHTDTETFPIALKYVLRQDPDIILIGEMRDLETIESAITIAETGHLVFATLHTNNALQSVNRIIDIFPAHQQSQVRTQLSFILMAILSQTLIPMVGGGRCLACEVMVPTPAIRNMIREDKVHQIYSAMQTGKQYGMQTMNEHLASLVKGERGP
ncbi:MAG: type IV pilus twitching motility protein PilT, partial [bacterium]|nr:type IV pilus twitching motility protein PilT [bacterium]